MQRVHILVAVAVLGCAGLAGAFLGAPTVDPPPVAIAPNQTIGAAESPAVDTNSITVHVAGAVRTPGLVTLRTGDRVAQAVAAAGGALAVADLSVLNLAATLDDGDQVTVPVKGAPVVFRAGTTGESDGLVDINHGTATDLAALPGVGPVLAERIVDYRAQHGSFHTVEDLLDVPGIGEGKLAGLREAVVLR